jgi:hypothetical protein
VEVTETPLPLADTVMFAPKLTLHAAVMAPVV